MNRIDDLLKSLPSDPGVYLLKDNRGKSLYIGKAKNLRNRVRSYFQNRNELRPQITHMVQQIYDVDFLITQNEREALIIENSLIKKNKPQYNIQLKDDKTYASLRLDLKEKFPRLTYTRRVVNDGSLYFGPFASGDALRKTKRLIHRIFPLRDCTDTKFKRHLQRPCLNYYMKLCSGPCAGKVTEVQYNSVVAHAKLFLKGRMKEMKSLLRKSMYDASEEMRFEDAAHYRDQINFLDKHPDLQGLISASQTDMDIVGFYRESSQAEFVVLFSRGGVILEKSEFYFDNANLEDDEILREFLAQYYGVERFIPHEILIPIDFDGFDVFRDWLSDKHAKRFRLTVPKRGAKIKLLEMARRNAEECFKKKMAEIQSELHLLLDIKKALCLTKIPERVECFDISNIQGREAVASMVRFSKGKHEKKMYKRFRINTINGSNDYGMMYEVLSRRFKRHDHSNWELPDLVLIDGGKGQLNIAHQVLEELGLSGMVDLASIAKGREEGEQDKIYILGRKNPILLSMSSRELLYLMRVRDEAHRFAITYHKKLRIKKALQSALDFIPGIGIKRKILLLRHFRTVSEIKNASIEELMSIPGINLTVANMLKQQLNI